jgi:hypothetical protein
MIRHGVIIDPRLVEVLLVNEKYEYAGTADRIARFRSRKRKQIFDLKTGNIEYAINAIAVQMAMYANAEYIYDWRTKERIPLPELDKTRGVIIHLPAGQAKFDLYELDLVAGWEAAKMAMDVRAWRKRKDLHIKVHAEAAATGEVPPTTGVAASADLARTDALNRIRNLPTAAQDVLKQTWPVPGVKLPDMNETQLDVLLAKLTQLETEHSAPFMPDADPLPLKKKPAKKKVKK